MVSKTISASVLLADISGSTALYQTVGNAEAQRLIVSEMQRLRQTIREYDGVDIREKGDDVLAYFVDPNAAFEAMRALIAGGASGISVHAGLHYGPVLLADNDIFGDTINLTARLAALANAGEGLLSRVMADQLSDIEVALFPIDGVWLKGSKAPLDIYSFTSDDTAMRTAVFSPDAGAVDSSATTPAGGELAIILTMGDRVWRCREADSVVIGRAEDCDVVLARPWVSRLHAVLTVRGGKATIEDKSSSGTYVAMGSDRQIFLRREALILTGDGILSPALPPAQAEADPIDFEVIRR